MISRRALAARARNFSINFARWLHRAASPRKVQGPCFQDVREFELSSFEVLNKTGNLHPSFALALRGFHGIKLVESPLSHAIGADCMEATESEFPA